jgi:hypothetical protein
MTNIGDQLNMDYRQENIIISQNESEQKLLTLVNENIRSMIDTYDKHLQDLMNTHKDQMQTLTVQLTTQHDKQIKELIVELMNQHDAQIKELLNTRTESVQEPRNIEEIVSNVITTLKPPSTMRIPFTTANVIITREEMEQLNQEDLKEYSTKLSKSVTSYRNRYKNNDDEKFRSKRELLTVMEANLNLAKTINRERITQARASAHKTKSST